MPDGLTTIAWVSLALGGLCALAIIVDILAGHRQHMWIMNVVWPLTALYSGPLGLWAYYRVGRLSAEANMRRAQKRGEEPPGKKKPFWQSVAVGATHCGSGCTLGDMVAESIMGVTAFTLFGKALFGAWVIDYLFAFLFGIAFQYYTIAPMRGLSPAKGLLAAIKADTLSLSAWQIGMYGWMAIAVFVIFGHELHQTDPVFWFMMQIGMLAGFVTSYPVNWWLLRKGIKEEM